MIDRMSESDATIEFERSTFNQIKEVLHKINDISKLEDIYPVNL